MDKLQQLKQQLQGHTQELLRGQIIMADLPPVAGSVQNGLRPCIVISNDKANKFSPNIIAIPLTSRDKKYLPTHHKIEPTTTNGLKVPSTALAEQILTISKQCIRKIIGVVDDTQLENINNIIKESVGIF